MSTNSGACNGTAELMRDWQDINLGSQCQQSDADGRIFYTAEFVTPPATGSRTWRWKLLLLGDSLFNFCIESVSGGTITLRSVVLYGGILPSSSVILTQKQNIGQSSYQSADFSVADSLPDFDEAFRNNHGCEIRVNLVWTEAEVNAAPIPVSPAQPCVPEYLYNKVMEGGDIVYELVSSDGQSFRVSAAIFEAKSAFFKRFFATEGWKEQDEGRMMLKWPSAVVNPLIRYIYLSKVDGGVCDLLPDLLDAAQMWELVGMKPLIEAQMRERLEKAARDADTDTTSEYLKMAHLHNLTSLVPICNKVLADNFDKFYDSDQFKQIEQNETYRHLVKGIVHHKLK